MMTVPSPRIRELETLLAKIRLASRVLLDHDMWDRWGAAGASPEERAAKAAEFGQALRDQQAAKSALEALVTATRHAAPEEIAAWAAAHDAYLAAFLEDRAARGEAAGTAAFVASGEREAWAEVRAGTRAFVDENVFYVTIDADRYRRLFGIDPKTLAEV